MKFVKRQRGRPPKDNTGSKTMTLAVRVSEDEMAHIKFYAEMDGYSSVSEYVRDAALKRSKVY